MSIEDELLQVGDTDSAPPPPASGIPKQRVPGWVRWPIRVFLLPFVLLDLSMQKIARLLIRPPFKQAGKCLQRGNCCHYIMLRKQKGILGTFFLLWNTEINGFFLRKKEVHDYEGRPVLVMGCRYLQKNGRCKHYNLRPMVCRKWPVIEHFGHPRLLKGCGFKAVPRK